MRTAILFALAVCPVVLQAQVNSPAQPQSAAVLESRLSSPAAPGAAGGKAGVPTNLRVSTGVVPAKVIATATINESSPWPWRPTDIEKTVVVSLVVEPNGTASHVKIEKPLGGTMDSDVIASLSKYRFQPGTLNNVAIPIEMNLTVTVASRLQ